MRDATEAAAEHRFDILQCLDPDAVCHDFSWLADQKLEAFEYKPIHSSKAFIRLLRIKPGKFRVDVIECEMRDFCLDDRPLFTAMSYFWGEPKLDQSIICNGSLIQVTGTLHDALKRYRQDDKHDKQEWIWADAFEAHLVNVDLGSAAQMWYPAFDLLNKLAFISEHEEQWVQTKKLARTADQLFEVYELPDSSHPIWQAYLRIFSLPWFHRTWVVQEVVLGSKVALRLGVFVFDWEALQKSWEMVFCRLKIQTRDRLAQQGLLNMQKLDSIFRMHKRPRNFLSTLFVMIQTKDFHVSKARDKINAILGLVNAKPIAGIPAFQADFTSSTETLYQRFAIHLIDHHCAQPLLNQAGLHQRSLHGGEMPSWVPDWMGQSKCMQMATIRHVGYKASRYEPPASSLATRSTDHQPNILIMIGDCVDRIECLTPALDLEDLTGILGTKERSQIFLKWHDIAKACLDNQESNIAGRQESLYGDIMEAFARTLLVDNDYTGGNTVTGLAPILDAKIAYSLSMSSLRTFAAGAADADYPNIYNTSHAYQTFMLQALAACDGRNFAITERGYLGLVPHCAQIGDRIAMIFGAPVPFVLREAGKYLIDNDKLSRQLVQLVGDAYVHGIMEGEAMDFEGFEPRQLWIA
ncbi:uncharacterized protein KY384_008074 [Bacidia gigantensis]|uniref:uncharacterized protein n=1 Tax=Bacidia gigantensis TaxID=2732470 RepID=UPI001D04785F|nr:uncharacterized protein KY384_008074 [Bacidia gigantensis]KAG8526645.1 hypothetical protein KY384_008074 [Bacidia gigantensis]